MATSTHSFADTDPGEAGLWGALKDHGSPAAREALFSRYASFARKVASRQFLDRGRDIEFPDLCQLAYAGLLEAIDRYDPGRGAPFERYAERRIAGSVLDGIAKTSEVREQISFRNRVRDERAKSLSIDDPAELSAGEAMDALVEAAIGLALGFMFEGTSVYLPGEIQDSRADAYQSVVWKEAVKKIKHEVAQLPDREKRVIGLHYLDGVRFEQIAVLLGVTKGRVSQIHRAALASLRRRLERSAEFRLEE